MGLLILGLILFVCLVIVHEYGHYRSARKGGVVVEEFGIGFPPKVWGKRLKSKMLLSINLLPLGGFVRLKGEHDSDTTPGSYGAAPLKTKVKIMTAGVAMNLLTALAVLTFLALVGMPRLVENQFTVKSDTKIVTQNVLVGFVEKDSPAANTELDPSSPQTTPLEVRDRIVSIRGAVCVPDDLSDKFDEPGLYDPICATQINTQEDLSKATASNAGQFVTLTIERGGEEINLSTTLRTKQEVEASKDTDNPKGYLGIVPTEFVVQRSTWSAPVVAVGTAAQFTKLTLQGIGTALADVVRGDAGKAADQVSGPVGIFVVIKDGATLGYRFILMIIAIISLTLAIMNILPIPALDGGRLFVTLLYRALNRPLTKETEERIHGLGFMALMLLFVLITIVDVRRFF